MLDRALGGFFRPFNRFFTRFSSGYVGVVGRVVRGAGVAVFLYVGLVALGYLGFARTPTGFVPAQDKQYLVSFAQLPDAATLDRTESVIRRMGEIALKQPGVEHAVAFPGLSINGFTNSPNSGIVFVTLKPFEERKTKDLSAGAIAAALNGQYGKIQDAFIAVFPPPPVMGLGTIGGFRMQVEDRGGLGFEELYKQTQNLMAKGNADPALQGLFSSYQVNVPQVDAEVDREKAESQGSPAVGIFEVDEEKVVIVPRLFQHVDLFGERIAAVPTIVMPTSCGQALVHRVDGDRGGRATEDLAVAGHFGAAAKPRIVSPLAFGWPASSFTACLINCLGHLGGPPAGLVRGRPAPTAGRRSSADRRRPHGREPSPRRMTKSDAP